MRVLRRFKEEPELRAGTRFEGWHCRFLLSRDLSTFPLGGIPDGQSHKTRSSLISKYFIFNEHEIYPTEYVVVNLNIFLCKSVSDQISDSESGRYTFQIA
jgi:hypothetical protein